MWTSLWIRSRGLGWSRSGVLFFSDRRSAKSFTTLLNAKRTLAPSLPVRECWIAIRECMSRRQLQPCQYPVRYLVFLPRTECSHRIQPTLTITRRFTVWNECGKHFTQYWNIQCHNSEISAWFILKRLGDIRIKFNNLDYIKKAFSFTCGIWTFFFHTDMKNLLKGIII